MKRICIGAILLCLLLGMLETVCAEEEAQLLNESGWTLWQRSWAVNADHEMCGKEELGGDVVLGLSRSGRGFLFSEEGTRSFEWSMVQNDTVGGALIQGEKGAASAAEKDYIRIEGRDIVIESFMGGLKVYDQRLYDVYGGAPYVVFTPADERNHSEKLVGRYMIEGTAGEALGMDSQAVMQFNEDGTGRQSYVDEDLNALMSGLGHSVYGEWILLDDSLLFFSDNYDEGERIWDYRITGEWIWIDGGELPPQIEFPVTAPIHYDTPKHFEEMAGTWCSDPGRTDKPFVVYRLRADGTGDYMAADRLLDPETVYETAEIRWKPTSAGAEVWTADGRTIGLTREWDYLTAEYVGELYYLENMEQYGSLLDSAEKSSLNPAVLAGVWELTEPTNGMSGAQLWLMPDGRANVLCIPAEEDPRNQRLVRLNEAGWSMTANGMDLYGTGSMDQTLNYAEGTLSASNGAIYRQIAGYDAWDGKTYPAEEIFNYMQTGLVGVWTTTIYYDMDYTGDHFTFYLAANGKGQLDYSRGSELRAQGIEFEWRTEENGFKFCLAETDVYIPFVNKGEWMHVSESSTSDYYWSTSYSFRAELNKTSDFWAMPDEGAQGEALIQYELLDDGTARLTDYFSFEAVVEIPAVIEGHAVSELGSGLFKGNMYAERVVLPEGIRKIGSEAFCNCSNLTWAELPDSLIEIGEKAFSGCSQLNAKLPAGIKLISREAFSGCEALTALNIADCRIGERAFFRCSGLESIVVSGATAVEKEAFAASGTTATLDLTGLLGSIGEGGFASGGIGVLRLPARQIKMGKEVFGGSDVTEVVIPGELKRITERMFEGCWYLEKVTIGEGIEAIENEAFANCQALSEVILPSTLRSIGNGAFSRSTAISAVSVPEGVRTLGEEAFLGCSALRLIVLPESLESIGTKAFFGCAELNELHIPGAQTQIADYILNRENTVIIGSAGSTAQAHAQQRGIQFQEAAGAAVSMGVSNTDDFVLNERSDGTLCITLYKGAGGDVAIPDSVNGKRIAAIGPEAFSGNESIRSVILPDGMAEIGDKAFFGCRSLESVSIPPSAAQFGRFIFTNCPQLVVKVSAGSQAEAYADANRLKKEIQ